jgi:thiol-disulfide isomerase/thioredoxin
MKTFLKGLCLMIAMSGSQMFAQSTPDFEIKEASDLHPGMMVYKGQCRFGDLEQLASFDLLPAAAAYKPDPAIISGLAGAMADKEVIVFLGTWCDDSHRLIPQLYRVLQDLRYPLEKVKIYALDEDKKGANQVEAQYSVSFVPTIIIQKDGKELGRVTETVQKNIEADLMNIVGKD